MLATVAVVAKLLLFSLHSSPHYGIAIEGKPERLIMLMTAKGCSYGVKIYSGYPGDFDKAASLLARSKVCK